MDLSKLAIHTQTNKPWSLEECIAGYVAADVPGISVWRHVLEPMGAEAAGTMLRDAGLYVPALVRGGFFPSADAATRQAAIDANRVCLDEAAAIGAEMVVLVVGAEPGPVAGRGPRPGRRRDRGLPAARRERRREARHRAAATRCMRATRAASTGWPRRWGVCQRLDHPLLGIAVDVYHVWWDPDLESEIRRGGEEGTLFAFHVCDWRVPTRDLLTDRTLMGEGCIDIRRIREWMDEAGFDGYTEVEIFSEDYWSMDQSEYVNLIKDAYERSV